MTTDFLPIPEYTYVRSCVGGGDVIKWFKRGKQERPCETWGLGRSVEMGGVQIHPVSFAYACNQMSF